MQFKDTKYVAKFQKNAKGEKEIKVIKDRIRIYQHGNWRGWTRFIRKNDHEWLTLKYGNDQVGQGWKFHSIIKEDDLIIYNQSKLIYLFKD